MRGGERLSKNIRDTDYLALSARVRAMETTLLNRERMEQLLDARSEEETVKLLQECGYPELDPKRPEEMDAALSRVRAETLADLADGAPDPAMLDIFKIRYDYHNAKALLKASAMDAPAQSMLSALGRIPPAELAEALRENKLDDLPGRLPEAVAEARETLETTRDPQLGEVVLDNWCYQDMREAAEETGSAFLTGWVRVQIDTVNLRALVRTLRMGKSPEFLKFVLLEGGEIDPEAVLKVSAAHGSGLLDLYGATELARAAEAGADALRGGSLTAFEKLCDDAVNEYLSAAQLVPFGEAPLIGYLAARETEYTNLRILLLGRAAGLSADVIRGRLRAGYV